MSKLVDDYATFDARSWVEFPDDGGSLDVGRHARRLCKCRHGINKSYYASWMHARDHHRRHLSNKTTTDRRRIG